MTDEILKKANELKNEIKKLEDFQYYFQKTWKKGKLSLIPKHSFKFGFLGHGVFDGQEILANEELSNRMYDLIEDYISELKEEYKNLK